MLLSLCHSLLFLEFINNGYSASQHVLTLTSSDFTQSAAESAQKRIEKIFCALMFCLDELGVWLTLKVLTFLLHRFYDS